MLSAVHPEQFTLYTLEFQAEKGLAAPSASKPDTPGRSGSPGTRPVDVSANLCDATPRDGALRKVPRYLTDRDMTVGASTIPYSDSQSLRIAFSIILPSPSTPLSWL
ncbi:hypothetical protein E5D57_004637 [Metarhizium anisopliae]|nr:hypothetical protein E5D57_004637 [Metarhizium anisopliae]